MPLKKEGKEMLELCKTCRCSEVCSYKDLLDMLDSSIGKCIEDAGDTEMFTVKVDYVCKYNLKKRERKGK